ncbi:hypothetical protein G6M89_08100 [Natronolimnobius sp. AArcel1]|uniref:hypothetical protein n=1 Tax=Natronolimnobius sp. AArcel1 TaxID=1679093 RepID=UPI0013EA355D|nr:hypothetical protein [Natronolimnobius sp. AArcel1]NGM68974.1 hypothetical protein [Natronolimnobius sp. AArcel1]
MQIDRFGGIRSSGSDVSATVGWGTERGISHPMSGWEYADGPLLTIVREFSGLETTVSIVDIGPAVALAMGGLLVLGAGLAILRRSRSNSRSDTEPASSRKPDDNAPEIGSKNGDAPAQNGTVDPQVAFEERIGGGTLNRLKPIVPDSVEEAQAFDPAAAADPMREINRLEQRLRRELEDAIGDGTLDPGVTSRDGKPYEIVNLPSQYREVSLPPANETIHVADIETVAADVLEDEPHVRDAARTIAALFDHCREIESYVRRQEDAFIQRRRDVEGTLEDVRDLINRFDGDLKDRVAEFVLEGRHGEVDGVVEIERELNDATRALHRCTFDEATRTGEAAAERSDELLMTVDFLSGVVGTIDHGRGTITIPEDVAVEFVADIAPIIERQYEHAVTLKRERRELVVEDPANERGDEFEFDGSELSHGPEAAGVDTPPISSDTNVDAQRGPDGQTRVPDEEPESGAARAQTRRAEVPPEAVADEVLFILRELDGGGRASVECQTERLPDAVAKPAVLETLERFCRRQTDIVATVELQAGAPPGFFELEFDDRTSASAGLETLRERFTDRYGR